MMERLPTVARPGVVGKHRPEQIAQMSTWARVPDSKIVSAAMHRITIVPDNLSTTTYVNPLDPGDQDNNDWYDIPAAYGPVKQARAWRN